MDDIRETVEGFIDAEHAARVATVSEPSDQVVAQKMAQAEAYLVSAPGSIVTLRFGRAPGSPASSLISVDDASEQYHPRALFLLEELAASTGPLFRAVVGSPVDGVGRRFDTALILRRSTAGPRIVGVAGLDPFAGPDEPVAWEALGGVQVPPDARVVAVEGIRRPTNPAHADLYDRWTGGTAR
jgi:hypothetical protein